MDSRSASVPTRAIAADESLEANRAASSSSGILASSCVGVLPLSKIQSIDLRESIVTRWFGTASLQFGVAGGTPLAPHSIPAIPREGARQLRDRLLGLQP